jgi:hypothetical protein
MRDEERSPMTSSTPVAEILLAVPAKNQIHARIDVAQRPARTLESAPEAG